MDIWNIVILALVQGITEFLPISSSAHLVLLPKLLDIEDQGLAFDVALHVGSLGAVLWYFRHDLRPLFRAWWLSMRTRQLDAESRLVWGVGLATFPVLLVGAVVTLGDFEGFLRSMWLIAVANLVFAGWLWWADYYARQSRNEYSLSFYDMVLIGLAQAVAIVPGTSRSGITITVALLLGLQRTAAARFSFLLSIPVIIVAGAGESAILWTKSIPPVNWAALGLGALLSGISAYICIYLLIRLLERMSLLPFVIYRVVLGVILLLWLV
ncbi:undecaprenyl-diphosphate phosphatase [Thioflexithrix psekupsensis]|uniref:Undecaprenyl-diphosphatase n=1 Tax=Thioflexithrix psekupsensis TaxID=1570016 RepID=A0A251X414_9GAMM|nr:undecaprenyl-diphosphate phosphatase [Thioflexithrix psekupsensis]OUD11674.1 undecaprenyl-diphosphatase [Thioflexithrix psekupsensis]